MLTQALCDGIRRVCCSDAADKDGATTKLKGPAGEVLSKGYGLAVITVMSFAGEIK